MIVLIDPNVWVSALINPYGFPAKILQAWLRGQFQVLVSGQLLKEVGQVLGRPNIKDKYKLSVSSIELFLQNLEEEGITVYPAGEVHYCRDPRDNYLLEMALLGQAEALVTRDDDIKGDSGLIQRMQAHRVHVFTVAKFYQKLQEL
ncbi:MAG: putative toxin-antitoxin system toxin component, PIN family [Elusimicrobia bacterium]|nr:putative toxin-antitoxin system toxin component, PIN family [Elusimicrobiota bacterium]